MLCLAIVSVCLASLVRKHEELEVPSDAAVDVSGEALVEEEADLFTSWACGSGDDAADECVKSCLDDETCRAQDAVVAAVQEAGVLTLQLVSNLEGEKGGFAYTVNTPCADFYGDSVGSALSGLTTHWSTKSSHCSPAENEAAECVGGTCQAYNDGRKRSINNHGCGSQAECTKKCLQDSACVGKIRVHNTLQDAILKALHIRCVKQEKVKSDWFPGEKRKCFYTPGNPCTDYCNDGFRCHEGRCVGVVDEEPLFAAARTD